MKFAVSPVAWQIGCLAILSGVLVVALVTDVKQRRIPNALVLASLLAGLFVHGVGPAAGAGGLLTLRPGALGLQGAFMGLLAGLLVFLPLYLLHATGAGDVKLMAAIGSFVGAQAIVNVALAVLIAGGVLALVRMVWVRKTRLVLFNTTMALTRFLPGSAGSFDPATQSADRMPYALAIASGVFAYGAWIFAGGHAFIRF